MSIKTNVIQNRKLLFFIILLLSIISVFLLIESNDIKFALLIVITLLLSLYYLLERETIISRRIIVKSKQETTERIENYINFYSQLAPIKPIPQIDIWSASPDYLIKIMEIINDSKPKYILEAGSGLSTLVAAYSLQKNQSGKIISLEHLEEFQIKSQNLILNHGLSSYAEVNFTPLRHFNIEERSWLWYGFEEVKIPNLIDMIIVDGPPTKLQNLSRYPILPFFIEKLSNNCKIILDDAKRQDEKAVVNKWLEQFPLKCEYIDNSKGACILTHDK